MVLCLTHSHDFYTIDIVQQSLHKAGYPSLRFNTDEFGTSMHLRYSPGGVDGEIELQAGGQTIHTSGIRAVWYRKSWPLQVPAQLDAAYHPIFAQEYNTFLQLFFSQLEEVPWINQRATDHAVGHDKLKQLQAAQQVQLTIPATLFTNDSSATLAFFEQCGGDMIAKLHGSLSKSMEGNMAFFPTTRITRDDLSLLNGLKYCPMIFQEYIRKDYELRVVYVEGEFFTGKIATGPETITDWRTIRNRVVPWEHYQLPLPVKEKIHMLMQSLDLSFGALDIIRHTNGDYVFLEINPQGEWGMLQRDLSLPIGETIAQKLINHIKNG